MVSSASFVIPIMPGHTVFSLISENEILYPVSITCDPNIQTPVADNGQGENHRSEIRDQGV